VNQLTGFGPFRGDDDAHLKGDAATLTLKLFAARGASDVPAEPEVPADPAVTPSTEVPLATFTSPQFQAFSTSVDKLSAGTYQVTYLFRLKESLDTPDNPGSWLATAGQDFRQGNLGPDAFVAGANGPAPELYPNFTEISAPDRLLDRATGSVTYNEDVPVFEFPRGPLLSVGALQHLPLEGARPFSIGNSWVGAAVINEQNASEVFDRFHFTGLVPGVEPGTNAVGDLVLPNPQLRPVRPAGGARVTAGDLRAEPAGFSARLLLQGGAFNLNSTNAAAWASVLRGVRFPTPQSFSYLDADGATGTADDAAALIHQSADAHFFRFSQSAQETYKAETGQSGGIARTDWYRKGMRTLSPAQVAALAEKISGAIRVRQAERGPFRSLEEFLAPAGPDAPSLLEQAIADAEINFEGDDPNSRTPIEFSSQFLTQGDIMTALAPVLFARSDTFLVRAYGEAYNPATQSAEGKAWCEALVQRLPEYVDSSQPPETAPAELNDINRANGRRFRIVSFRWLTRSDL
jgi:hypothetical protein